MLIRKKNNLHKKYFAEYKTDVYSKMSIYIQRRKINYIIISKSCYLHPIFIYISSLETLYITISHYLAFRLFLKKLLLYYVVN